MGSSTDDFGKLTQLLKLKRYEQPPPRFFNEFSGQVLARLQAGEPADEPGSFFGRWLHQFGLSPIPVFACGLIACGLVLYGVALSLQPNEMASDLPIDPAALAGQDSLSIPAQPASFGVPISDSSSSNPVMQTSPRIVPVRASFGPK